MPAPSISPEHQEAFQELPSVRSRWLTLDACTPGKEVLYDAVWPVWITEILTLQGVKGSCQADRHVAAGNLEVTPSAGEK